MVDTHADCYVLAAGLTKCFSNIVAVDNVSYSVKKGEVFGLLGPNGAGKTTTVKMSTGQSTPTNGSVEICGHDIWTNPLKAKECLSVVPQSNNLDRDLTLLENLKFHAKLQGLGRRDYEPRIEELLRMMDLTGRSDDNVKDLSGGMQRKATIARALIRRPKVLFLDEPSIGLDPAIRLDIWNLIGRLAADGMAVLLTTHYMEEADRLCDTIAIMNNGKIITQGTSAQLKSWLSDTSVVLVPRDLVRATAVLVSHFERDRVQTAGESVIVNLANEDSLDSILRLLGDEGISVTDIRMKSANLEEVFLAATGRGKNA